jgi:uncharacterized protein (TIGR02147 family)
MNSSINIFNYTDYRIFLNDLFIYHKNIDPKYSHRFIAKEVEASSTGWFSDILKSRINCTPRFVIKLANLFKLTDKQKEYFELLVLYNQAGSIEEKHTYFKKMLSFTSIKCKLVFADQFTFYSKWYIPAIRELLSIYEFRDNYKELSQKLCPAITIKEAKEAIDVLLSCTLIERNDKGFYKPCDSTLEKDASTNTVLWATYMSENISLSMEAIYRFKKEERDISALTLLFSKKGFEIAREKIKELRKTLLKLSEMDTDRTIVYQTNLQLFPLSKSEKRD